ncbi:MAG: hypothetical protein AAF360_09975 [Pseudomonadota bacterium]
MTKTTILGDGDTPQTSENEGQIVDASTTFLTERRKSELLRRLREVMDDASLNTPQPGAAPEFAPDAAPDAADKKAELRYLWTIHLLGDLATFLEARDHGEAAAAARYILADLAQELKER